MGIYEKISNVMRDIGAIGKDRRNTQQNFNYRGVEDVMNVLQPLLVKNGLFLVPEVMEHTREERQTKTGGNLIYSILKVKYTVFASDGSRVDTTVIGEGMDSADKASNKAMSAAFKYACFQLFCIPTEEMNDPDSESPEQTGRVQRVSRESVPPKDEPPTGYDPAYNQARFLKIMQDKNIPQEAIVTAIQKVTGMEKRATKLTEEEYNAVVRELMHGNP